VDGIPSLSIGKKFRPFDVRGVEWVHNSGMYFGCILGILPEKRERQSRRGGAGEFGLAAQRRRRATPS
jgi:hypothetical protein